MGTLDELDRQIAKLLTEGRTDAEMAEALGMTEADLAQRLARVYLGLGASSRAEATTLAFRGLGSSIAAMAATAPQAAA